MCLLVSLSLCRQHQMQVFWNRGTSLCRRSRLPCQGWLETSPGCNGIAMIVMMMMTTQVLYSAPALLFLSYWWNFWNLHFELSHCLQNHHSFTKIIWGRAHQNQFVGWWLEERRRRRGGWLSAPLIGTRWVIVSIKDNPNITLFANRWWSRQGWLKKWRLRSRPSWWRRRRERSTLRPTFSGFLWAKMIRKMLFFQIVIKQTRTV